MHFPLSNAGLSGGTSMTPTRRTILSAVGAGFAAGLAGCSSDGETGSDGGAENDGGSGSGGGSENDGGSGSDGGADSPTPTNTDTDGGNGMATRTVQVRAHDEYGDVLVDSEGLTLYMFDRDTQGAGASTCSGECARNWPPLTTDGTPAAGDGVSAELTTFERENGDSQVTAAGWPLYYFAGDEAPGDANGHGLSDVWWVLAPDGTPRRAGTATEQPTATATDDSGVTGGTY